MRTIKVLVFPCGSEIGLELHKSLKDIRFIELHGASGVHDHGSFVFKHYHEGLPLISDSDFDSRFISFVEEHGFDIVFPGLDDAIVKLVDISNQLPCKVIAASASTVEICRDKRLTYNAFVKHQFNPRVYTNPNDVDTYPVLLKPAIGQGSAGVKIITNQDVLVAELNQRDEAQVVCEYLPGEEYTIDCFTDRYGVLRYCSQRTRRRTKAGISVNSTLTNPDAVVRCIAEEINTQLEFRGMWFFQLKLNAQGEYRLLEIAPRVAGTMCLERAIGVNLPLLAIFDALDLDVDIMPQFTNCEVDRALANVFALECEYGAVYLDFDDTLVRDGKVVLDAIRFVYQCVNRGIPVHLLSRHAHNIYASLADAKLSECLFASVQVIGDSKKKSEYIDMLSNPIFIDDSFAERKEVYDALGIKVFGPDNLAALIDWHE